MLIDQTRPVLRGLCLEGGCVCAHAVGGRIQPESERAGTPKGKPGCYFQKKEEAMLGRHNNRYSLLVPWQGVGAALS